MVHQFLSPEKLRFEYPHQATRMIRTLLRKRLAPHMLSEDPPPSAEQDRVLFQKHLPRRNARPRPTMERESFPQVLETLCREKSAPGAYRFGDGRRLSLRQFGLLPQATAPAVRASLQRHGLLLN